MPQERGFLHAFLDHIACVYACAHVVSLKPEPYICSLCGICRGVWCSGPRTEHVLSLAAAPFWQASAGVKVAVHWDMVFLVMHKMHCSNLIWDRQWRRSKSVFQSYVLALLLQKRGTLNAVEPQQTRSPRLVQFSIGPAWRKMWRWSHTKTSELKNAVSWNVDPHSLEQILFDLVAPPYLGGAVSWPCFVFVDVLP